MNSKKVVKAYQNGEELDNSAFPFKMKFGCILFSTMNG